MKLEKVLAENDKITISDKKQIEKQSILLGTIKPNRGHTIFEINTVTGNIVEAKRVKININWFDAVRGDFSKLGEIIVNENCVYVPALNSNNAQKKYKFDNRQESYYQKEAVMKLM